MERSDLNQSYAAFDQSSMIVGVIDMSLKSWVMSGTLPGVKRQPLKIRAAEVAGRSYAAASYVERLTKAHQKVRESSKASGSDTKSKLAELQKQIDALAAARGAQKREAVEQPVTV